MNVLVVGAAGQLGAAVVREFAEGGAGVVGLTRRDVDVTDAAMVSALVRLEPNVIINCAAWNDVDRAEDEPRAADAVNRRGVEHLAAAARAAGAVLVHYSTDFVFDGRQSRPYDETARPAPLNCYGTSKLAGEQAAADVPTHYVLRLSSVFGGQPGEGAAGRVTIDRMADALRCGREVRACVDRTVTPSYTVDVARATRALVAQSAPPGLYHCVNSGTTTWYELARYMAEVIGVDAPIVPVSVAEIHTRAKRPRFCALSNEKLHRVGIRMPGWQHALRRHLEKQPLPTRQSTDTGGQPWSNARFVQPC